MSECQKLVAEMAEQESSKPPDGQELPAPREKVSKLTVDKEALEERMAAQSEKHKKCSKEQRDEIEKLQKMKADYDVQLVEMLQQVKDLSESNTSLQHELDELKVATQAIVDMDISEEDDEAPFFLVEQLQKVPQGIMKYLSKTTRQYVSHVLGLVKFYLPQANLAPLGEGLNPDSDEGKFDEYLGEVKPVANRIADSLEQDA